MQLKIDFSNKRAIAGGVALICIIALVFYLPSIISATKSEVCTIDGVCQHELQLNFLTQLVPVFVLSGIIIGAIVFFFVTSKIESKQRDVKKIAGVMLRFLNPDERKLVNLLIENNGKVLQAEVSRLPGMGKVKSHRVVQRLIDRGVIEKETLGKTNIVRFAKEIKEGLAKQ
ncbi:MAG: hypothetical protein NTW59_05295 [Candidatus Diapherotrites archaeon]|nr:hypothetical protein [Candidatus Diapherotrites archaeon]